jgi:pyruvate dehydrogenase E1 component alpha subunit
LIEARTWRWRGHWASDDQSYRTAPAPAGVEDPIDLFAYRLLEHGAASPAQLEQIHADVGAEVAAAMRRAHAAPDAGAAEVGLDDVFA